MSKLQPSFFQFFSFSVYVQVTIQRRDSCREKAQAPLQALHTTPKMHVYPGAKKKKKKKKTSNKRKTLQSAASIKHTIYDNHLFFISKPKIGC